MYDFLGFLNFLYRFTTNKQDSKFSSFKKFIENILVLFCHSFHKRWVKINWYTQQTFTF